MKSKTASLYWNAWRNVSIHFKSRDLARIPARWARYDARASILTGAPRAATSPVNALLNFIYSGLLESESRLALLAHGMAPEIGVLHADQRNRDSFALDAMEPIRPEVDAFVLDLLEDRTFASRDFVELPNGVCRIRAPLTHDLALTLPHWRMLVAPIAADLAQTFRNALDDQGEIPRARQAKATRRARVTPIPSPLIATPRKSPTPRPYASRAWGTPQVNAPQPESLALIPVACAACGKPVLKRRRRYCEECLPKARRERGLRAIALARKALAAQALTGNDPRASAEAGRRRGATNAERHRRNREWKREHSRGAKCDRAWFLREITPKLDKFSLSEMADASGLSLAACSRFRAGARVPHPRHWSAFIALIGNTGS